MRYINDSVGNFVANEADDVWIVKKALNEIGYRKSPVTNGIIEQETDNAIKDFQKSMVFYIQKGKLKILCIVSLGK